MTRYRVHIFFIVALAFIFGLAYVFYTAEQRGLNILLVVIDTLRADHLGCYGYPGSTTPNIDRFAKKGIQFKEAVSQAPWTLPSVSSILTGKYPSHHGAGGHSKTAILGSVPTIAEVLQEKGYLTQAFVSIDNLLPAYGLNRGFNGYSFEPRNAEQTSMLGINWLQENQADPYFLFLHYVDPHYPYSPPFLAVSTSDYDHLMKKKDLAWPKNPGLEQQRDMLALYDGEIRYTDYFLGVLFQYLAENNLYKNTLIIITSDHGEEFWDHGKTFHGYTMYDEQLLVPLIIRSSVLNTNQSIISSQASLVDIVPTILSLLGMENNYKSDGISLTKKLGVSPTSSGPFSFSENIWEGDEIKSLRNATSKLLYYPGKRKFITYDLEKDPSETLRMEVDQRGNKMVKQMQRILKQAVIPKTKTLELDQETKNRLKTLGYIQ